MTPDPGAALREAFLGLLSLLLEWVERWRGKGLVGKESQNISFILFNFGVGLSRLAHVSGPKAYFR
jgi:hypothetical protein